MMSHVRFPNLILTAIPTVLCMVGTVSADTISSCPYTWNSDIQLGTVSTDVLHLQQFLNTDSDTTIATSGTGSLGHESKKFGILTKQAVIRFQNKYANEILTPVGLKAGTGAVRSATRAKLNTLCSVNAATTTIQSISATSSSTQQDFLTVTNPEQPAQTLAPAGALYIPFTNFSLTAGNKDVTISRVKVRQVGLANDNVFDYLSLLDADHTEVSYAYFNADHAVTFKDPFTITAGTTQAFTVAGNMALDLTDKDGQKPQIAVISIDASSPLSGTSLPISGASNTANASLIIGTGMIALSSYDPMSPTMHYINDTNVRFSGVRITAGSEEDVRLDSITWEQVGTAGTSDLANVTVVIDGVTYPTINDGRYYTATIPSGLLIKKGNAVDIYIQGNPLAAAANRTIEFDIQYSTDIKLTGMVYGYGLSVSPSGNTDMSGNSVFLTSDGTTDGDSLTPFFAGSVASIQSAGFVSIDRI